VAVPPADAAPSSAIVAFVFNVTFALRSRLKRLLGFIPASVSNAGAHTRRYPTCAR